MPLIPVTRSCRTRGRRSPRPRRTSSASRAPAVTPASCSVLGARLPAEALAEGGRAPRAGSPQLPRPRRRRRAAARRRRPAVGVPSLQAVYEGGVRSVELAFDEAIAGDDRIELVLRDRAYGLRAGLHVRVPRRQRRHRTPADRHQRVRPPRSSWRRLDSGSWALPEQAGVRHLGASGGWAADAPARRRAAGGGDTFGQPDGHHLPQGQPVDHDRRRHRGHRQVWTVALAWSGSWRLTAQRRPEGDVAVSAGFGHEGPELAAGPGASLRTPAALRPAHRRRVGAASRAWHDYAREHCAAHGRRDPARALQLVGGDLLAVTEEASSASPAGPPPRRGLFVVDDGWFGSRTGRQAGARDWHPKYRAVPRRPRRLFDGVASWACGRALGRAGDGQPGQRPLPEQPPLGAAPPRAPPRKHDCATSSC